MLFYYIIDLLEKNPDVFDSFNNLKKLIIDIYSRKADFVLMIGDINAKWYNWSINDTRGNPARLYYILLQMRQLISDPTHILQQSSSCTDLIFTNQPNIIMDSDVYSSLPSKSHHQIT